jgi:hypothetical protein
MKKLIVFIMMAGMSFTFMPTTTLAANKTNTTASSADATAANALILRLSAINEMDMNELSSTEKKGLRKEVRSIKQQLSDIGGGIYISAGVLIIILILLIILL